MGQHSQAKLPTEFLNSKTNCLVGHDDPTLCQQILDHAKAKLETKIQPNRISDHVWWKPVAAVE